MNIFDPDLPIALIISDLRWNLFQYFNKTAKNYKYRSLLTVLSLTITKVHWIKNFKKGTLIHKYIGYEILIQAWIVRAYQDCKQTTINVRKKK